MNSFPFPQKPSARQDEIQAAIGRWAVVLLPIIMIGHLLGAFALIAALMSSNFNILGWIE
jgi:hypothetical protein